jgi:carbon-monoxide dehydrogenase medium subunit
MKPAPFRYFAPESLAAALALKAEHGEAARFLSGGQSLVPAMNFRLAQPEVLIDLAGVPGLDAIEIADGTLRIGAFVRYHRLERDSEVARHLPLLREVIGYIAHAQIRTRGTIGGNLAHADPASEMPATMLALDARFHVQSAAASRVVAASDFFLGQLATALTDDEMLVAVEVRLPPARSGGAFLEVARRKGDFAMMGVVGLVTLDEAGRCAAARLAFCNAADRPLLAEAACAALVGQPVHEAAIAAVLPLVQAAIDPPGGLHASVAYQRHLANVLTRRVLLTAAGRAIGHERAAA